jgi:hypothetical protein
MRRRMLLLGGGAVVLAGAGGWWWQDRPAPGAAADTGVPTATAKVVKTDLSTTTQIEGSLGYTGHYEVFAQGAGGTVTWLPRPGQVIGRGQPAFELDGQPVRLLYGSRPMWRSLGSGVSDGSDVLTLERNLVALNVGSGLTPNGHFSGSTAAVVRRWQRATGQTVTGRVELGSVTIQPGPVRVIVVDGKLGSTSHGEEPLLSGSSTTAAVTIRVPADRTHLVRVGNRVSVTMPDGKQIGGRVTQMGAVADAAPDPETGRQAAPTVSGLVTMAEPDVGADLDQAPVQVAITDQAKNGVLAVPITALVALAGGGYGVYIVDGERRLVGVTPGLFADTLVEVSGDGVREGATVEVPAS